MVSIWVLGESLEAPVKTEGNLEIIFKSLVIYNPEETAKIITFARGLSSV